MPDDKARGLTHAERQDVEELSAPRSPVIYEVVRQQGEDELCRPDSSLFWSGIAAGITIMASVIVQAALRHILPDAPWREAVSSIGYSVGFLMVILGRMQLFTEQGPLLQCSQSWLHRAGPSCGPRRVFGSSFSWPT